MEKDLLMKEYEQNQYKELCKIIKNSNLRTVFQPIVSLRDCNILGYEALTRISVKSTISNPEILFDVANKYDKVWELEKLCYSKALESIEHNELVGKLFLNVNPTNIDNMNFTNNFTKEYLAPYSINFEDIIFEITERYVAKNVESFKNTIEELKNRNIKIAMDDVGSGYSGLNLISDIKPKYIKLDMKLIRNIDKDFTKQALVRGMYEFSKLSDCYLIAEGIETQEELSTLIEIGIHYGQGYLIQKPNDMITPINEDIINTIKRMNNKENNLCVYNIYIKTLCKASKTIPPDMLVGDVDSIFKDETDLLEVCVTENGFIKGVVTRKSFYSKLGWKYGYSLYYTKPISIIMNKEFLSVDFKTPIDKVIKLAMSREQETLYDYITVTKDSKYYGIVAVKDLIEKVMELEVRNAKYLNPLTELPGNVIIEQSLEKCILYSENYCVLYFDIDNFKAYNDIYGFENGDKVLKILAKVLMDNVPSKDFIGHIGGDDFIAILSTWKVEEICRKIIDDFDELIKQCYTKEDLARGFIVSQNRHGVEETFPLVALSIAGVTDKMNKFINIYTLAEESSKLKKKCKQNSESSYIIA